MNYYTLKPRGVGICNLVETRLTHDKLLSMQKHVNDTKLLLDEVFALKKALGEICNILQDFEVKEVADSNPKVRDALRRVWVIASQCQD